MPLNFSDLLSDYAREQPKRASGGLYAIAGFRYQLNVYLARLAESLTTGGETLEQAGRVFIEALSDFTAQESDRLICVQAKRTLTRAALKHAAEEIAAIERFLALKYPEHREHVRFQVVVARGEVRLTWADLPAQSAERATVDALLAQGRLDPPYLDPDPAWRAVVAVWNHVDDPYAFVRFALDRSLGRGLSADEAVRVRDDICERYTQGRRAPAVFGQMLRSEYFAPDEHLGTGLDLGREVTLARVRDRQYMTRKSRRDALLVSLIECYERSREDPQPAAQVFWLSGRSGVGKSVLLVQMLERLVAEGRRVLWLGGAAEKLEPALRALALQPDDLRPEFIGIDDLYDRDARTRLDLASLGAFIDETGPRPWPLVLTCGPKEFAEAFELESRFRGFELHVKSVQPVTATESDRFVEWYRYRTGREPTRGPAFAQCATEGGLFISLAVELEHGDMREFARRFAERVELNGLDHALRLPLALNRLYLRAPFGWLEEQDREHLATLNQEGDFRLLDPGEGGKVVRLTHPHLANALYLAMRKPGNPSAYAHDLSNAFRRAVAEGDMRLVGRMLAIFSDRGEGIAGERLAQVDDTTLSQACAVAWRGAAQTPAQDAEVAADIATSWACWALEQPGIAIALGDDLLARAIASLDDAVKSWPFCWLRLWRRYSAHLELTTWAETHLPERHRLSHRAWSFVWEHARQTTQETWREMGMDWLEVNMTRPGWAFVWKPLLPPPPVLDWVSDPVLNVGMHHLRTCRNGPDWSFVLQDMLRSSVGHPTVIQDLATQAWSWLPGRENRLDWSYVWQALLAQREHLSNVVPLTRLLAQGAAWLPGREHQGDWIHVWNSLLAEHRHIPSEITWAQLLSSAFDWLRAPEARGAWPQVWRQALEQREHFPNEDSLEQHLILGWNWLSGREDRDEWCDVFRSLLALREMLPKEITRTQLIDTGCRWLLSRPDTPRWPVIAIECIEASPHEPAALVIAKEIQRRISAYPNGEVMKKVRAYLKKSTLQGDANLPTLGDFLAATASPAAMPVWQRAIDLQQRGIPVLCKVSVMKPRAYTVELDIGLQAWLPRPAQRRLHIGEALNVVIVSVDPNKGTVEVRRCTEIGDKDDQIPSIGSLVDGVVVECGKSGLLVRIGEYSGLIRRSRWPSVFDGCYPAGSRIQVRVSSISPKGLQLEPTDILDLTVPSVGDEIDGTIVNLVDYGLFVNIGGRVGLLHRSKLPPDLVFSSRFARGSRIRVRVDRIDEGQRVSLTLASCSN